MQNNPTSRLGVLLLVLVLLVAACTDPEKRVPEDRTPEAFSFEARTGVEPGVDITSEAVTITGINVGVPASVSDGGTLLINGEAVEAPTTVVNGDELAVMVTSSAVSEGVVSVTVDVGGVTAVFMVTTRVISDDEDGDGDEESVEPFSFEAVSGAEPGVAVTSDEIAVRGVSQPVTATVTEGGVLVIDGVDSGVSAEVSAGAQLAVRVTSSSASEGVVSVTVDVGGVTAVFTVTTRVISDDEDGDGDEESVEPFSFEAVTGVQPGSMVTSEPIEVRGVSQPVTATVTEGGVLVIDGVDSGVSAEVSAGALLAVRVVASTESEGITSVVVTIGDETATFTVTTWVIPSLELTAETEEATPGDTVLLTWAVVGDLDEIVLTGSDGTSEVVSDLTETNVTIPSNSAVVTYTLTGTSSTNAALQADDSVEIGVPLWVCEEPADVITFEDAHLEEYFRAHADVGVSAPDDLTCADAHRVEEIHLPAWEDEPGLVESLVGMQHLANLTTFWAEFNEISDLTPIAGLTGLQVLHLDGNRVTDLTPIAGLTELTLLGLWDNGPVRIGEAGVGDGVDVYCRDGISDISPLAGLVNVETLYLSCNDVSDLSAVGGMTSLELAFVIGNRITSIAPLEGLTSLRALRFSDNLVESDEGVLGSLTGLRWLEMAYNQLGDDSLLGFGLLDGLFAVDLEGNFFSDLSPILNNASLPAAEGVDDDQQPDVATVSLGYNCFADPEAVGAALVTQGFAVLGATLDVQRDPDDCQNLIDSVGGAETGLRNEGLQLFRERTNMR